MAVTPTKVLGIRLPAEHYDALERAARRNHKTVSVYVRDRLTPAILALLEPNSP